MESWEMKMHSVHVVAVGVWSMRLFFREIPMLRADDALTSWNTEICPRNSHFSSLLQSLCFRIQKMMEVYKPDWCETREEWSVYLFSPQNKWVSLDTCGNISWVREFLFGRTRSFAYIVAIQALVLKWAQCNLYSKARYLNQEASESGHRT